MIDKKCYNIAMNKKHLACKHLVTKHPSHAYSYEFNSSGTLTQDLESLKDYSGFQKRFAIENIYNAHEKKYPTIEEKNKLLKKLYNLMKKEIDHATEDIDLLIDSFNQSLFIYKRINTKDMDIVRNWFKKVNYIGADRYENYEKVLAKESSQPTEIEIPLSPSIAKTIIEMKKQHQNEPLTFTISNTGQIKVINGTEEITKKAKLNKGLFQILGNSPAKQIRGHITGKRNNIIIDFPENLKLIHLLIDAF